MYTYICIFMVKMVSLVLAYKNTVEVGGCADVIGLATC